MCTVRYFTFAFAPNIVFLCYTCFETVWSVSCMWFLWSSSMNNIFNNYLSQYDNYADVCKWQMTPESRLMGWSICTEQTAFYNYILYEYLCDNWLCNKFRFSLSKDIFLIVNCHYTTERFGFCKPSLHIE